MVNRLISLCLFAFLSLSLIVSCTQAEKGSVSGTVVKGGKPATGMIKIINPADLTPIAQNEVFKDGKFFLKDVPRGEWLITLTGRTGGSIGYYHYVKVGGIGFNPDMDFDVMDEDPKAKELLSKFSNEEETENQSE